MICPYHFFSKNSAVTINISWANSLWLSIRTPITFFSYNSRLGSLTPWFFSWVSLLVMIFPLWLFSVVSGRIITTNSSGFPGARWLSPRYYNYRCPSPGRIIFWVAWIPCLYREDEEKKTLLSTGGVLEPYAGFFTSARSFSSSKKICWI